MVAPALPESPQKKTVCFAFIYVTRFVAKSFDSGLYTSEKRLGMYTQGKNKDRSKRGKKQRGKLFRYEIWVAVGPDGLDRNSGQSPVPGGHMVLSYNTLILTWVRPVNLTLVLGIGRSYDQGPMRLFWLDNLSFVKGSDRLYLST